MLVSVAPSSAGLVEGAGRVVLTESAWRVTARRQLVPCGARCKLQEDNVKCQKGAPTTLSLGLVFAACQNYEGQAAASAKNAIGEPEAASATQELPAEHWQWHLCCFLLLALFLLCLLLVKALRCSVSDSRQRDGCVRGGGSKPIVSKVSWLFSVSSKLNIC